MASYPYSYYINFLDSKLGAYEDSGELILILMLLGEFP